MFVKFVYFLLPLYGYVLGDPTKPPLVETPYGSIQGTFKKSYRNRTYSAFEGIPYAKPPVGDLRFKEAEPAEAWDNILEANKTYICLCFLPLPVFGGVQGTEDCLYVYVYTPRETINPNELLDVVVHIHGGGFMMGSPNQMAAPHFIMDQDVVYVSFNYRLGILGFLSTEDSVVPGNNGLKDQNLAMKWIKENIALFGGNPNSITLTGLSAGASSVHYHYLSPLSKGLFHKGFSQSGTALAPWSVTEAPLVYAQTVAKNLSCPITSNQEMVDCLTQIDGKNLVNGIKSVFVYRNSIPFTPFAPVVEKGSKNPFLAEYPYKLVKEGKVYDVPWIISNVKDEGLFPVGFFVWLKKLDELNENWNQIMTYALELQNTVSKEQQEEVTTKIRKFYIRNESLTIDDTFSLVKIFTDRAFMLDAEKAIRLQSKAVKSPIYYYIFSYIVQLPTFFLGVPKGSCHGDDGRLLFKMFGTPEHLKESDEKMMDIFTNFIANYAKTGIPSIGGVDWLPVNPKNENIDYLDIEGPENIKMKSIHELAPKKFWESLPINEMEKFVDTTS